MSALTFGLRSRGSGQAAAAQSIANLQLYRVDYRAEYVTPAGRDFCYGSEYIDARTPAAAGSEALRRLRGMIHVDIEKIEAI